MRGVLLHILFFVIPVFGFCQSRDSVLVDLWEASCASLSDTVLAGRFGDTLSLRFSRSGDISLALPSLRGLGDRMSADGTLRVLTWAVEAPMHEWRYMGLLVHRVEAGRVRVWPLRAPHVPLREGLIEEHMLSRQYHWPDWLGGAYYAVLPFTRYGTRSYLLLGVSGSNLLVTRRVLEVLTFDERDGGRPVFGVPFISYGKRMYGRLLFSHSARADVTIHPIEGGRKVLLDHLSPSKPQFAGLPQYYGPDFSQDVLSLQGDGLWLFESDQVVVPE